ncbi:hypothetical protein JCM16138_23930 [Thermococcus atlanticus]
MSRRIGLVLAVLMLGMTFSTAVTQNLALAEPTNSPYQAFWSILNREAGLIVKLNSTNNATLAEELIQNSQLGALNAANISAQTWQALEELKASKVKTYYSPKELQEIAQNISKNGLPEETIQTLKKQGWSDEEIKALQDYITKNKDNITTGFNLTEFLENFSQAFIKVAFKYNQYEAWAWKKLLNTNTTSLNLPSITTWKEKTEVPLIWQDFKNFNKTFQNASLKEKLHLLENLKKQIMNISKDKKEELISSTSSTTYAKNPAEYEACSINPSPNPITTDRTEDAKNTAESLIRTLPRIPRNLTNPTQIGFESVTKSRKIMVQGEYVIIMIITRTYRWKLIPLDCSIQETTSTNYELYYWNAFKALEELSNLGVLLKAEEFGNHDPKLNQLEHNITSHLGEYFKTSLRGEYSENFHLKGIYTSEPLTNPKKPIAASQSNTPSSEGYLSAGVSIVKDDVTENYATYRVEVNLKAEDNTISNIKVRVSGTGLSDSTSYDLIHPDDGVITWYSKPSGRIQGSDIVTVNGTVTITYTPNNHDMPTSINSPEEGLDSNTQSKTITIPYSETIRLGRSIDKSKIHFQILPSDSRVKPDNTVTFYVKIINDNNAPVSGSYELNIATPTGTITRRGSISADSNSDSGPIQVATITYASTGTYGYSGTFKFNGYEKQDAGSIIVEDDNGNTGSLKISGVNISPQKPEDGDNVSFTVKVKSTYSTSQNAELELYVDGNLVDSTQGVINANSEETLNLHWIARQGEHSYTIKAYSLVGGEKFTEDAKGGKVNVGVNSDFSGVLSVNVTGDVSMGARVRFAIDVRNVENAPRYSIPVRVYYVYSSPDGSTEVIKVKEAVVDFDPLGGYQDWFDFNLENPGTYDFYLMVNGQEKDEKTIKVNTQSSISAVMTCSPEFVTEDVDSVSCHVNVENLGGTTEDVWITNIHFAGGEIYDKSSDDNLVTPSPSSLSLDPYSNETFTFTIPVNDELQERVPVDLSDINPGTPIAVKTYLNTLQEPVMYVIQMNPREKGVLKEVKDYIVNKVENDPWGTSNKVAAIIITGKISAETNPAVWIFTIWIWSAYKTFTTPINEGAGDNNLIVGDEQ